MSHIRLSANPKASGSRNTSIGSASRGAVTPESAKAFTEREMAFQEKNTPTENLGGKSGVFEGHWVDRTAKADRRMLDLQRLRGVEGAQISLDAKEMLDYGKMKEAQAHEVRKYKFAAMYPRSGEPATEAKVSRWRRAGGRGRARAVSVISPNFRMPTAPRPRPRAPSSHR